MKTVLVLLILLGLTAVAEAQTAPPVQIVGTVQWIAGQGMALALDTGSSVPVDLAKVGQDAYQGLTTGDRIVVTGILSPRRNRVFAIAIAPAQ